MNHLDLGERHAISLAVETGCPLLIEDRIAKAAAIGLGIETTGSIGLLLAGRRRGVITAAEFEGSVIALRDAHRIGQRILDQILRHPFD